MKSSTPAFVFFAIANLSLATATHAQTTTPASSAPKLNLSKPDWTADEPFSTYPTIRQLENGTVIAADFREIEVRLLGTDGKTIRPIGRKGSGPGEYTRPARLIALAHDTTLLLDREARRLITITPAGKTSVTQQIPASLGEGSEQLISADVQGRVYFRFDAKIKLGNPPAHTAAIARWSRDNEAFDTVALLQIEVPRLQQILMPNDSTVKVMTARRRVAFAPVDDWVAAPSGRVAVIHAMPYHVEWFEPNRRKTIGADVPYTPVAVTDADRKRWEPKGPPFIRDYPKNKSPFEPETAVIDESENVWVCRNEPFASAVRRWDVFDAKGKLVATQTISADRRIVALNRKFAYLIRTDSDGLSWLERYSR